VLGRLGRFARGVGVHVRGGGLLHRTRFPDGDPTVLDVVLHLVVAEQHPRPKRQREQERGEREGDDDGRERQSLGQRIDHQLGDRGTDEGGLTRGTTGDLKEQVRPVPEDRDTEDHPHQRTLHEQVEPHRVEPGDRHRHRHIDRHVLASPGCWSFSSLSSSPSWMPSPKVRSRFSTTPTMSRKTPVSKARLDATSSVPNNGASTVHTALANTGSPNHVGTIALATTRTSPIPITTG